MYKEIYPSLEGNTVDLNFDILLLRRIYYDIYIYLEVDKDEVDEMDEVWAGSKKYPE